MYTALRDPKKFSLIHHQTIEQRRKKIKAEEECCFRIFEFFCFTPFFFIHFQQNIMDLNFHSCTSIYPSETRGKRILKGRNFFLAPKKKKINYNLIS